MLPKLRGSAKQVAWAEKIRSGYVGQIERRDADIREAIMHSRTFRRTDKMALAKQDRVFSWIKSQAEASWWIDHRGVSLDHLLIIADKAMRL